MTSESQNEGKPVSAEVRRLQLLKDLAGEYAALDAVVAPLPEAVWDSLTPFASWTVRDEISHLAFYDGAGRLAATDRERFNAQIEALALCEDPFQETLKPGRALSTEELLAWWRREREALLEVLAVRDLQERLPWYGPFMSLASFITARVMETWAHGQDIYDTLGRTRPPTDRLRHVAHLGVSTFGWSFMVHGLTPPADPVRVELAGPAGTPWAWGPAEADNIVRGDAEDFCLVVTQRRHINDTGLTVAGSTARQWMLIAQAFAGPPATGPGPGRFPRKPPRSSSS